MYTQITMKVTSDEVAELMKFRSYAHKALNDIIKTAQEINVLFEPYASTKKYKVAHRDFFRKITQIERTFEPLSHAISDLDFVRNEPGSNIKTVDSSKILLLNGPFIHLNYLLKVDETKNKNKKYKGYVLQNAEILFETINLKNLSSVEQEKFLSWKQRLHDQCEAFHENFVTPSTIVDKLMAQYRSLLPKE